MVRIMETAIRQLDEFGRISIPAKWRKRLFSNTKTAVLIELEDRIVIIPLKKIDLTKYFDSLDLGVDVISDWKKFERKIYLGEK